MCAVGIALYRCESWTPRNVLRVSWREKRKSEWTRTKVCLTSESGMIEEPNKKKIRKYGKWKRRGGSLVEVCPKAKRGRRQQVRFVDTGEWKGGLDSAKKTGRQRSTSGLRPTEMN